MRHQCRVVYQERADVRESVAQLIENGKTVRVYVAPVLERTVREPSCGFYNFPTVACPKEYDRLRNIGGC